MTKITPTAVCAIAATLLLPMTGSGFAIAAPSYHVVRTIHLPGADGWDYVNVDSASQTLFVSRGTHVQVVDLKSGTLKGDILNTTGVHGIAIDDKSGHGFTSNGRANTVTEFDLKTLERIQDIPVDQGPDCIIFDPATERVFTFNGRAGTSTAIDAVTGKVLGTIPLPGRPEFAVADGKGLIYNNIESLSEVAQIDSRTLKVLNTWSIAPGDGPSGIAMDTAHNRVFSVCGNQMMTVLNPTTGKIVATPAIGNGDDASAFDQKYQLAFGPNGEDGTLTEVHEDTPDTYTVVATVPTQAYARIIALDRKTNHIYAVTATALPAPASTPPQPGARFRRTYQEGSFVVLDLAP
jgi:hypothetical protein